MPSLERTGQLHRRTITGWHVQPFSGIVGFLCTKIPMLKERENRL